MALDLGRLIRNLKKRHRPSEEFSCVGLKQLIIATEGKTSKGAGILEHIWELAEGESVWISEDRICIFVKPDTKLISAKLDRYANVIPGETDGQEIVKLNKPKLLDRVKDAAAARKSKREKEARRK